MMHKRPLVKTGSSETLREITQINNKLLFISLETFYFDKKIDNFINIIDFGTNPKFVD
jgi:hypothetical protein